MSAFKTRLRKHLPRPVYKVGQTAKFLAWKAFNDFHVSNVPHLDDETLTALRASMAKSKCYLEYGAGGSTVMATELVNGPIRSVESDLKFLRAVLEAIPPEKRKEVDLVHANIGLVGQWGKPVFPREYQGRVYVEAGLQDRASIPDLILIDGRYRVACVLHCLLKLPENWEGVIYVDDYYGSRDGYSVIENFIANAEKIGRSIRFGRGVFDEDLCRETLLEYIDDYR